MSQHSPAAWLPDPFRRFQQRYWDGAHWTEHVASDGHQGIDEPDEPSGADGAAPSAATGPFPAGDPRRLSKIQRQLEEVGLTDTSGDADRAILEEPVLVINQKGKLLELRAEYAIFDQKGSQVAAVQGRRQSSRMQVLDMRGRSLLDLRREASILTSKVIVSDPSGAKIGRIVPSRNLNKMDRIFRLEDAENKLVGAVYVEDRRQRKEFNVQDVSARIVARITMTRGGVKEMFTNGDNYVVQFLGSTTDPLRTLSIAAALTIDAAFHQG